MEYPFKIKFKKRGFKAYLVGGGVALLLIFLIGGASGDYRFQIVSSILVIFFLFREYKNKDEVPKVYIVFDEFKIQFEQTEFLWKELTKVKFTKVPCGDDCLCKAIIFVVNDKEVTCVIEGLEKSPDEIFDFIRVFMVKYKFLIEDEYKGVVIDPNKE